MKESTMQILKQVIGGLILTIIVSVFYKDMPISKFNNMMSLISIIAFSIGIYVQFITLIYVFIKNGKHYSQLVKHTVSLGFLLMLCYFALGILWHHYSIIDKDGKITEFLDAAYHTIDTIHPIYHMIICQLIAVIYIKKPVIPFIPVKDCGCIGEYLIKLGYINQEQLDEALDLQKMNCEDDKHYNIPDDDE